MQVRKNQVCFRDGVLVKLDLDEKGKAVGAAAVVQQAKAPAAPPAPSKNVDPAKGPSKQELMGQLKALGISFKATMSSAALTALLPVPKTEDPSASAAEDPAGGQGGTGNQDVI